MAETPSMRVELVFFDEDDEEIVRWQPMDLLEFQLFIKLRRPFPENAVRGELWLSDLPLFLGPVLRPDEGHAPFDV